MKIFVVKGFLLTISIFFCFNLAAQTTYFIKEDGSGNGLSWKEAAGDLASMLKKARKGDQLWVAKGVYFPTKGKDRNKSFIIKEGVSVLGGFEGYEVKISQRNSKKNPTILSGAIGEKTALDNSFTIVKISESSENTILDGFIIENGNADGIGSTANLVRCGGGLFVDGHFSSAKPTIENCIFRNNFAYEGGAVYNNGRQGEVAPYFKNCTFINNGAKLDGGAVYTDARKNGVAQPIFSNCIFEKNVANYGGALYNYGGDGICKPIIDKCKITSNKAFIRGGAIMNTEIEESDLEKLENSHIEKNESGVDDSMVCFMN